MCLRLRKRRRADELRADKQSPFTVNGWGPSKAKPLAVAGQTMTISSVLSLLAVSALISAVVTRICIVHALRRGLLDHPNERSSHTQPVPRVGGIGITLGFLVPSAMLAQGYHWWAMLAGMAGIAGVGLLDDFRSLTASRKYVLQLAIVGLLMWSGMVVRDVSVPIVGTISLGWLAAPLTLIWLTGFPNFFNFIDGTNGMAGGTAVIYGGFFAAIAYIDGSSYLAVAGLLLAGTSLGFLFYNFPRANTFMGDAGSLFLGLGAATQVVLGKNVLAMLVLCSVVIYDCTTTILIRLKRGENIFAAHRSHHYQRLVRAGWGHTRVAWLYFAMHCIAGALALLSLRGRASVQVLALSADLTMLVGLTMVVRAAESSKSLNSRGVNQPDEIHKADAVAAK